MDDATWNDRLCDQFETAWKSQQAPRIEDYLVHTRESARPALLRELLLLEVDYRARAGQVPAASEYRARFPDFVGVVNAVLETFLVPADARGKSEGQGLPDEGLTGLPATPVEAEISRTAELPVGLAGHAQEATTWGRGNGLPPHEEDRQPPTPPANGDAAGGGRDKWPTGASACPAVPERIGKYMVIELLDEGGQSLVYRALDPDLKREVVIKLNRSPMSASASGRDALLEQGKLVARLEHPHLDRVYELGFDQGRPFLVMQYAAGLNLTQRVSRQPLTHLQQAALVAQVARAVAAAHAQGIIHRDIKPANIMVDPSGQPRLIDFGMAWLRDVWAGDGDEAAGLSGTPQYMAPEQARGEAVDHRSDIFALGAVLYALLTGKAPFSAATRLQSLQRARNCELDAAALSGRGIPRRLRRICLRALQARPDARYQAATDLAGDLERYVRSRRHRVYVAAAAAAVLVAAGIVWLTSPPDFGLSAARTAGKVPLAPPQPADADLAGAVAATTPQSGEAEELQIRVWQNDRAFPLHTAVPLRSGDDLSIEWRLPAGHFGTLFWFDTEGGLNQLTATGPAGPDSSVTFQWPEPGKSNVLEGPPGTEVIFLCSSTSAPPRLQDVKDLLPGREPWPELTGPSLLVFDSHKVELRGARLRGPGATNRDRPEELVRLRADALRQRLAEKFPLVQGVAFGHVQPQP